MEPAARVEAFAQEAGPTPTLEEASATIAKNADLAKRARAAQNEALAQHAAGLAARAKIDAFADAQVRARSNSLQDLGKYADLEMRAAAPAPTVDEELEAAAVGDNVAAIHLAFSKQCAEFLRLRSLWVLMTPSSSS